MATLKQFEYDDLFFLTIKSIDGLPILLNETYYRVILDSLEFCRKKRGWQIFAYTILINHIHLVLRITGDFSLSETMGNFKKFTAHKLLLLLKNNKQYDLVNELIITANKTKDRNTKIWRRSCWPKVILSKKFLLQKVNYTDYNAEKHGVVKHIENYKYTSHHNHNCKHEVVLEIDDLMQLL